MSALNVCNRFVSSARTAAALAMLGFTLSGCGRPATDSAAGSAASASADHDHAGESHDGHSHAAGGDVEAALAKLSPEDRALAEAQQVCLVAKEPLGSMGAPIKVEHNGQVAFLCCEGCRETFEADPEKFLAELSKSAAGEGADAPAEAEAAPDADSATDIPAEGT